MLQKIFDHRQEATLAASFRRKRFELLYTLVQELPCPVRILDVGGEQRFWEMMGLVNTPDYQVVLLNIVPQQVSWPNFRALTGDATDLSRFADHSFDVAFSNSVIEHLGSYPNQQRMAEEIRRVGQAYYVQTPNLFFPLEPHFLVPLFQFFPFRLQVALLQRFNLGWYHRMPSREQAEAHIRSHRLLRRTELQALFPDGKLYLEKVCGLTKSFIVHRFPGSAAQGVQ
ncbi:MAG: class I SAM-dependent methyltransferase [Anaerolineales bacterium]|nr:class I SAM-dependent methyltransferase [Anaerolineales bacterium]